MKIYCLMENTPFNENFKYEHGLSLYIETSNHKILFDFGQSNDYIKNAKILGIDLALVDIAILSHGHYDHGGGIASFLEINNHATIYLNSNVFNEYYNGLEKYIGLDLKLKNNSRFTFVNDYLKIDEELELCTCEKLELKYEIDSAGLKQKVNNELIPDKFNHEQYLLIKEQNQKIVISGCSHKGILNIMNWLNPNILIGGFHYKKQEINKAGNKVLDYAANELIKYNCIYYTCHCTGINQYNYLKERLKDKLNYLSAGEIINITKK